jgi:hypothetical protein
MLSAGLLASKAEANILYIRSIMSSDNIYAYGFNPLTDIQLTVQNCLYYELQKTTKT